MDSAHIVISKDGFRVHCRGDRRQIGPHAIIQFDPVNEADPDALVVDAAQRAWARDLVTRQSPDGAETYHDRVRQFLKATSVRSILGSSSGFDLLALLRKQLRGKVRRERQMGRVPPRRARSHRRIA